MHSILAPDGAKPYITTIPIDMILHVPSGSLIYALLSFSQSSIGAGPDHMEIKMYDS